LHGLRPESATRPRPRFRSCSIDTTAYRLAVTEQLGGLRAAVGQGTFGKQKSPIDLDQAKVHAVLAFISDLGGRVEIAATGDAVFSATI
jgi:hypothetical protein